MQLVTITWKNWREFIIEQALWKSIWLDRHIEIWKKAKDIGVDEQQAKL